MTRNLGRWWRRLTRPRRAPLPAYGGLPVSDQVDLMVAELERRDRRAGSA